MNFLKCILLLCLLLLLTGCWDRNELAKTSIVTGMAVDKGESFKYKLTIETTEAREMTALTATGLASSNVASLEGNTIGELVSKFNVVNATIPIYSHMRVLVISEELAKDGMLDFMDFFDRNRQIRDDFLIVIARTGKAGDILNVNNMYKKSPSLKLFTQLTTMQKDWGGAPDIKLNDYTRIYNSEGQAPVLPAVQLIGDPKKGGNIENLKSEAPDNQVKVNSLAAFKNGKLAGYASLYEVRDLLFVQGKIKSTSIDAKCVDEKKKFEYRVTHSTTKITAKEVKGIPNFYIKIKTEGILDGTECLTKLGNAGAFESFELSINKTMEKEIKEFIKKTKEEFNADIFGLGDLLREQDYKNFKKYKDTWDDGYAKAKMHVDFNSEIKRSGLRKERYIENK
ncbi:Ger(x)C family spore germination protein [Niallia taxi]|uniref:Ger(X)C family spore germination protein n=1 Tax=Niallia taxi TaxID=2499688 RepID=A0A437KB57_9BACI|nr:Ger(x)C family spore germination protein [Niallia taxi]MCM3213684.1 Ger(x)C family spore germination protein [Niallia taxi]RVT62640.1 Ger(x)C family spore germination protein [Niallia taxi]